MRLSAASVFFLACLALSGCTSSLGPDSLAAGVPSRETTSSVTRPSAPVPETAVPSADVGEALPVAPRQEELAWAGPVPQPQAFTPQASVAAAPSPSERPVAAPAPMAPEIDPAPRTRSQIYGHRFRDVKPINFGSSSPRKLAVHGVDVSRWQGAIDWQKLRTQGANFVYIKATDGGDHLDPMFRKNWRDAKQAGIKRGAYHFFYWCRTAGEQADWFIRNVPREAGALPPVIDVEWNGESSCKRRISPERVREKMQVFMDKLEKHYGQRPIIYTAPDFYRDNLKGAFLNYPFWLRSVAAHPSKVYPGRRWVFWQYSGSGISHGVDGRIDLNVFHGSEDDWHDWVSSAG
ncbi:MULTISPECIES: glycoside hydrolase family 25 protein [Rhizobium]|uniref:Cell-wall lytic enzyme n=1 Tax=Rhizobium favelukesii TaxID=348824 RepID=W6R6N3_9HYPH|nr:MULTISPECIES: GH25 family lysozyme [Rhizobium]MCA0804191.1 glycosyl hydrolase [Rhizobium sp. T1473]MCS0462498.1 glycosyl hydrolase [Rhizobium favelukesii]UFS82267.1 glycosyl hydrolase [Rhizobium sp. T136]CDM56050.1 cell-wall lytic enzyme [Rhizobium favelukesii]